MPDILKQTLKHDLTSTEKRKEFLLVIAAISLFYIVYFFSSLIGYFSILGYIGTIAIVYLLYRMIRKYSYRFTYQINNGTITILQSEGKRNPKILAEFALNDIISMFEQTQIDPPQVKEKILAARSEKHPDNVHILVRINEKLCLITLTPNKQILTVLRAFVA